MKKLIAILAVFAFMTAALFAQDAGTWSLSGNGQINTRIDFKPLFFNAEKAPPTNHAQIFGSNYGDDGKNDANGDVKGNLTIGYTKGVISAQITFNQRGAIGTNFQANGENFQFRASRDLADLLLADKAGTDLRGWSDLWGNYTFKVLNDIVVEAAVNRGSSQWEQGFESWSHNDRLSSNYLLVNVKPMAGLEVGFKLPEIFDLTTQKDFLDDSLRRMVFGVKYNVSPIAVAFQFALNNYGLDYAGSGKGGTYNANSNRIYFGAGYTISPQMSAGAYFRGEFGFKAYTTQPDDPKDAKEIDTAHIVFGGNFNYSDGPLAAGLTLRYWDTNTAATADKPKAAATTTFRVGVDLRYDILSNVRAKLGLQFNFPIWGEDAAKDNPNAKMQFVFTPEITYNFTGNASDDPGVGIRVKYRIQGRLEQTSPYPHDHNELTIQFKWSF